MELNTNSKSDPFESLRLLDPLNVLETFVQDLQRCEQSGRALRLLLKAVADSIKADGVFVLSLAADDIFESVGHPVRAEWCRRFLQKLLADSHGVETQLVRTNLGSLSGCGGGPAPSAVAMVYISKSRQTWVAALHFTPNRQFRLVDIKLMAIARRMLVAHIWQARVYDRLTDALF